MPSSTDSQTVPSMVCLALLFYPRTDSAYAIVEPRQEPTSADMDRSTSNLRERADDQTIKMHFPASTHQFSTGVSNNHKMTM
jgi:hypothetical protein